MGTLDGRTIVVAGVGTGLGRRLALTAAREGAAVLLGARTEATLRAVADDIAATGAPVGYQVVDLRDEDAGGTLSAAAVDRFGRLDGLAVVAALDTVLGGIERASAEDWQRTWELNVLAPMRVVRAAVPELKQRGGSVVLIGSQAALTPSPHVRQLAYSATKSALHGAAYHLAAELGRHRVRVNVVAPGWMWGDPVRQLVDYRAQRRGVPAEEVLAEITAGLALPEMATEEDVAEAVAFFLSDRSRAITGQCLLVNAGEVMR